MRLVGKEAIPYSYEWRQRIVNLGIIIVLTNYSGTVVDGMIDIIWQKALLT